MPVLLVSLEIEPEVAIDSSVQGSDTTKPSCITIAGYQKKFQNNQFYECIKDEIIHRN